MEPSAILLYITCNDAHQANTIAHSIISEQLAACANVFPEMQSIYLWDGKINSSTETVLILKTSDHLRHRCQDRVRQLHSYQVPCVLEIPISGGNNEYIRWLVAQTLPP
jgi:periplasmic divalent cation tolerance protein